MENQVIPEVSAQDSVSELKPLTPEEYEFLLENQNKIIEQHMGRQVPPIGKLFPSLASYRRKQ